MASHATIHDGFGSCETVGFDSNEGRFDWSKVALTAIAGLLVVGGFTYIGGGLFASDPAATTPGTYMSPSASNPSPPCPSLPPQRASFPGENGAKLKVEQDKLKKISDKMHKRQLAMRAELYDIDKRDKAMAAREDAVEAKLSKAHYELKQAQRMQETTMGYETKFSALATCKSQVRELEAEKTLIKRQAMKASLEDAHTSNMGQKDRYLENQKAKQMELEESKAAKKIKEELENQQAELDKRVKIQSGLEKLNTQKASELEEARKDVETRMKRAKRMTKRLKKKLDVLKSSKLVQLEDVKRLLGEDAADLIEAKATIINADSVIDPTSDDAVTPPEVLSGAAAPDSLPDDGPCDRKWCSLKRARFNIVDGETWGGAPERVQKKWFEKNCHDPSKQQNSGCGPVMAASEPPGPPKPPAAKPPAAKPPAAKPPASKPPAAKPPAQQNKHGGESHAEKHGGKLPFDFHLWEHCDRAWCAHHSKKHKIRVGKGWGDAPEEVRAAFWTDRNCVKIKKQDNKDCVDKAPPPPPPAAEVIQYLGCDSRFCAEIKEKFGIVPGKSWGKADAEDQGKWFERNCHRPHHQINAACSLPGAVKRKLGSAKDNDNEDYEKNAGRFGGRH